LRRRGFTLTELLVAVGIGALVMAVLGGFVYYAGRPTRRAQARMSNTAALAALEKRLQGDIARARGLPQEVEDGAGLEIPVHPGDAKVTYRVAGGVVTRQEDDAEPTRLRLSGELHLNFEVEATPGGRTRILARSAATADTRNIERDGSEDTRGEVQLTLDLPNHVFDGKAAFGTDVWQSPQPD